MKQPQHEIRVQDLNRIRKTAPSRERAEEMRRIAIFLGLDTPEGKLCEEQAEFMLDVRQALRGGTRTKSGSRHWKEPE